MCSIDIEYSVICNSIRLAIMIIFLIILVYITLYLFKNGISGIISDSDPDDIFIDYFIIFLGISALIGSLCILYRITYTLGIFKINFI